MLRFEKREDCTSYTVYFKKEYGKFKPILTTDKTSVRLSKLNGASIFKITGQTTDGRTVNIGTADNSAFIDRTSFTVMGSKNTELIVNQSLTRVCDSGLIDISPLTVFYSKGKKGDADIPDTKYYEYLSAHRSDRFLFDFYSTAVNGILKTKSGFVSPAENEKGAEALPKILPEQLYKPLIDIFAAKLCRIYHPARIILVRTAAPCYYALGRQVKTASPKTEINNYVRQLENYFISLVKPQIIDLRNMYYGDLEQKTRSGFIFDRFYIQNASLGLEKIMSSKSRIIYNTREPDVRIPQVLCYYESVRTRGFSDSLFDRQNAVDKIMLHTSKEFIAENKTELKEMLLENYRSVTDIYRFFDFGKNTELKNTVKVIAAVESNTLQRVSCIELLRLLDKGYRLKRPVANFIRATLEKVLGERVEIKEKNIKFMTRLAFKVWDGLSAAEAKAGIEEYNLINSRTAIDALGCGMTVHTLQKCHSSKMGIFINSADLLRYIGTDNRKAKMYMNAILQSPSMFIAVDFAGIVGNNRDKNKFFSRPNKDKILAACDELSELLYSKYESNIILSRASLNKSYADETGEIKPLCENIDYNEAQELLKLCEERFISNTGCYVTDCAKNYISDECFAYGGAGITRYETEFYYTAAAYIDYITNNSPMIKYYDNL